MATITTTTETRKGWKGPRELEVTTITGTITAHTLTKPMHQTITVDDLTIHYYGQQLIIDVDYRLDDLIGREVVVRSTMVSPRTGNYMAESAELT